MDKNPDSLQTLQDIKQLMERSSRFLSLSGWSGVSAGICALIGAWLAYGMLDEVGYFSSVSRGSMSFAQATELYGNLILLAFGVLISAVFFAFIFTYNRSKKNNVPFWNGAAMRLFVNLCIPLGSGGIFALALIFYGSAHLVAPACLIFYGLTLIHAGKYTLGEIRWLGIFQLILGFINLIWLDYGLILWAIGFGVLHIIYGIIMWLKYERNQAKV